MIPRHFVMSPCGACFMLHPIAVSVVFVLSVAGLAVALLIGAAMAGFAVDLIQARMNRFKTNLKEKKA